MAKKMMHRFLLILAAATMAGGCDFFVLEDDLERLEDISHLFTGKVSSELLEFHAIVVVALNDPLGGSIASFRMMSEPGTFEIRSAKTPTLFFGFADMNRDLRFQVDEPFGWAAGGEPLAPARKSTYNIDIVIDPDAGDQPAYPGELVGEPLENHLNNYRSFNNGTVSSLADPLFSNKQGKKGLWEPFAFVEDGGSGIHFLQPYDAQKTPVLFVHGINGAPRNFTALVEQLDQSRYQPWVLSYPSGLPLSWLARGMFQFIEVLHHQYDFNELHIVAHSMGGLVSRGSVNLCVQNMTCDYLHSFTTISTP